jgi:glycyl-tRNA synthetase
LGVKNLSPESRGNEGMHDFIVANIPHNPETKQKAEWTEARNFNLMLESHLGPVANDTSKVYLRPETCQSLFTDFKAVLDSTRTRIPFGLAQIGKAFRNEITPGQFLYRTREFEQMEIEYFVPNNPDEAMNIFNQWKADSMQYRTEVIGIQPAHLRFKDHEKLAHYAVAATDVEYLYPRGFGEIQGVHNRTYFDLTQHQDYSGKDMQYKDPYTGQRYIPRCVEASFGLGRQVMVAMLEFYDEEKLTEDDTRIVIRFPKQLAPVKFAILPLIKKDEQQVKI